MRLPGPSSRCARERGIILWSVLGLGLMLLVPAGCVKDEPIPTRPADPPQITFRFPLDRYVVEQDFGVWNDWAERYHCGEDAQGDSGTAVYAATDGEISHSGQILGYGWLITINHQNPRVYTLYGHLSTRRWKLEGGTVRKGDLIGYLGDGDEISGVIEYMPPHLHFGIREGSRFEYPGDASDNRWTAGFTNGYPTMYGWFDPTDFIRAHSGTP